MKLTCYLLLVIFSLSVSCKRADDSQLVIWTYDSFVSEWGPGPEVSRVFQEKTGISISWVSHGDSGEIFSRLLAEGADSGADIILGVDQNLAPRILDSGLLQGYRPAGYENILPELILDEEFRLIPMDHGYFAIVYDSEALNQPPRSLEELCNPRFASSLILIDPRTSSPGLGFFGWVMEIYGDGWQDYWRRLQPSILTITGGWSAAYGLFTRGEAPMVLSYTSSPGYHLEYEDTDRYRAAMFEQGHPIQIEAAGLLRSARNRDNARLFLDFMLSPAFQEIIPLTNWMYPVIDIPLPDSFSINHRADRPLFPAPATEAELNAWAALMMR
ncbi:MAG: thiamine ABC transporter substrate-binding protein [Treponema sp.]|nr:thiamine ABC transporter substrate-binding protein [Treponema sp.]